MTKASRSRVLRMQKVEMTPKQFAALGRMCAWEGCLETCDGDLPRARGCVNLPPQPAIDATLLEIACGGAFLTLCY